MIKVAIDAKDLEIRDKAQNFIVDLNMSIQCESLGAIGEKNYKFMEYLFQLLDNPETQLSVLSLLNRFINRYDGNHITDQDSLYEQQTQ